MINRHSPATSTPGPPGHSPLSGQLFTFATQHVDYTQQQQQLVLQLTGAAAAAQLIGADEETAAPAPATVAKGDGGGKSSDGSKKDRNGSGSREVGKVQQIDGQAEAAAVTGVATPHPPVISSRSGRMIKRPKQHHDPLMDDF